MHRYSHTVRITSSHLRYLPRVSTFGTWHGFSARYRHGPGKLPEASRAIFRRDRTIIGCMYVLLSPTYFCSSRRLSLGVEPAPSHTQSTVGIDRRWAVLAMGDRPSSGASRPSPFVCRGHVTVSSFHTPGRQSLANYYQNVTGVCPIVPFWLQKKRLSA